MIDLIGIIKIATENGKPCVLATVTDSCGSVPQKPGARMLIYIDGKTVGSVGGGCVEGNAIKTALQMLASPSSDDFKILKIDLTDPLDQKDGDICGGSMHLLLEKLTMLKN